MKNARMLFVVVLVIGSNRFVVGQELSKRDQMRVAVQEVCPISGERLGSMGTPIKVQIGKERVFLCCKGCLQKKVKPKHWATIHTNFAKAQRICPVMENELPDKPKWTIVEGQIVYVCCPPCIKKIAADPKTHLAKLDKLYTDSLRAKKKAVR